MGNSAGKESRNGSTGHSRENSNQQQVSEYFNATFPFASQAEDSPEGTPQSGRLSSRNRHDLSFLGLGGGLSSDRDAAAGSGETRKETKQERAARHAERERVQRAKERERSMKEESVDGGYLVTLGVYVGPEDFSKGTVRQLQIERRLAPFWRGLNDHSSSWTEHQLVAAARGKPIPAPDEIPSPEDRSMSPGIQKQGSDKSEHTASSPVPVRPSPTSDQTSRNLSTTNLPDNGVEHAAPSPLFRGRAKTLTSLTSSKTIPTSDLCPLEIHLPKDPSINGQPIEAYLYKDVLDCPICFLSYPLWLNKTRCCDQPICSECFVQIKRPEPHPPEHGEEGVRPPSPRPYEDEDQLISEPAACPFCVQPEFGVLYDPPPFRRGLAYANAGMDAGPSSFSSTNAGQISARRRTESVSADSAAVITTDKVRPDWAKKLADARAHQARRSAAATALHTAAYRMGGSGGASGFPVLGRRRRVLVNAETGQRVEGVDVGQLLAALEGQSSSRGQVPGSGDLFPGRGSSRGHRAEDLEEMMMMEAIRQSIAAEEERKKKSDKEARKEEKKKAKEQKKADKAARKGGYPASANSSGFFGPSASTTNFSSISAVDEGKGKARAPTLEKPQQAQSSLGWNPMNEPSSTLNTDTSSSTDAQRHLEKSRADLDSGLTTNISALRLGEDSPQRHASSSSTDSFESATESTKQHGGATGPLDPSITTSKQQSQFVSSSPESSSSSSSDSGINFRSLAEMIGKDDRELDARRVQRPRTSDRTRSRGGSDESTRSQPPQYHEPSKVAIETDADAITAASRREESISYDQKHFGDVSMLETAVQRERSH